MTKKIVQQVLRNHCKRKFVFVNFNLQNHSEPNRKKIFSLIL